MKRVALITVDGVSVVRIAVEYDGQQYTVRQVPGGAKGKRVIGVGASTAAFITIRACRPRRARG